MAYTNNTSPETAQREASQSTDSNPDNDNCCPTCGQCCTCISTGAKSSYAGGISLIFASLAAERQNSILPPWVYGTSSFTVNFPMAWVFLNKCYQTFANLNNSTGTYKFTFTISILQAVMTSIAALAIGYDAIFQSTIELVQTTSWPGVLAYWFNNFSTRFVATVAILNPLIDSVFNSCSNRNSTPNQMAKIQLLADIKQYPAIARNITIKKLDNGGDDLMSAITSFYKQKENDAQADPQWCHPSNIAIGVTQLIFISLALQTGLLWLAETSRGYDLFERNYINGCSLPTNITHNSSHIDACTWGSNDWFVTPAAIPNLLFYLRSSYILPLTLHKTYQAIRDISSGGYQFLAIVSFMALVAASFCSGQGMGNEMGGLNGNYGAVGNRYFQNWMHFVLLPQQWLGLATTISAGAVTNLNAALLWTNQYIFKKPKTLYDTMSKLRIASKLPLTAPQIDQLNVIQSGTTAAHVEGKDSIYDLEEALITGQQNTLTTKH